MRAGLALAAVLAAAPMLVACSDAKPESAAQERLIEPPADDPALLAATKSAVDSLDVFWGKFDAKVPGVTNYALKLRMTAPDGYVEHIWAVPLRREGGEIVAQIANDPVHLTGLQLGSEVRVKPDLVSDWTYEKGGKFYGHFTTRALARYATPEQRAETDGMLAPTPLESNAS